MIFSLKNLIEMCQNYISDAGQVLGRKKVVTLKELNAEVWDVPTEGVCNPRFICSQGIPAHLYPVLAWDPGFAQNSVRFIWEHSCSIPVLKNPAYFLWDNSWLSANPGPKTPECF